MPPKRDTAPSLGKVVVTGGCGFLGHHIVNLIVERHPQSQIAVLDIRTTHNRNSSSNVSYHDSDITDLSALQALLEKIKPDIVIHTASPTAFLAKDILYKVNVEGTKNMLKAAQESGVKAFVYTSSASVIFNPKEQLVNADETWPMVLGAAQPEYYTSTKGWAEIEVLKANRTPSNFLTCAIRPAGIYGEGDVQVLPPMISAYRKGQTKFQIGENENLFDFTYVGNLAHAHLLAAQALLQTHKMLPTIPLDTERVDGEAFFITNGQPVYFWDFARVVWHECGDRLSPASVWHLGFETMLFIGFLLEWIFWVLGRKPNITRQQVKYSTFTRYFSIEKAKMRLGYKPIVNLEDGVRRGVRYILAQEKKGSEKKAQ